MNNLEDIYRRLKHEDKAYSNKVRILKYIYIAFSILYCVMIFRHIMAGEEMVEILSSILLLLGMMGFFFTMYRYQRIYSTQDYTLPTLEMLKQGKKRYLPFANFSYISALSIIAVFSGVIVRLDTVTDMIISGGILLGVLIVSIVLGLFYCKEKYGPLLKDLQEMIDQLDS